jgi:hypothetical protein
MLLNELIQPNVPVYHMTTVRSAISILQSRQFKLSGGSGDERHNPSGLYYLSVARSTQSAFMQMMGGSGAVILVLNKNRLQSNNKVVPYKDPDAAEEIGGWGMGDNEMEDRVYSKTPTMRINPPLNNTVLQIRLLGGPRNKKSGADFSHEEMLLLGQLCQQNGIPFGRWADGDEQAFLLGR